MAEEWESESAAVTQLVEVVYGREAVFGAGDHHLSGKEDTGQKPASEDKGAGGVAGACQEQEEAMVSTEEDVGGDEGATEEEVADGDLERTLIESAELQGCSGTTSNSSMDLNCVRIEDNGKKGLFEVMAGEEVVTGTGRWQVAGNDGEKPPASLMDKGSEAEDAPLASKSPTRLIMNDHHLATGSPTKLTLAEAALPAPVALMLVADVEEVKYTQTSSVNTVVYESANPVLKSYETFHSASSAKLAAEDQPTPDSPLKERFLVDAPPSLLKQAAVSEVKYAPTRPITLLEEEEEAEMAPTSPAHLAFETEDCQISASQFNLGTGVEINVPAFSSHVMETHIPIERDAKTQYNNKLPNQSEKFSSLTSPKKPTPSETLKLQENLLNGAGGSEPEHNLANQKTQEADTLPQTLNSPSNRSTQEADTLPQTLSPSNRSILYNIPNMASPQNCADVEWPYALTNPPKRLSEDNLETMCKHKKLTVKEVPDYSASCQPETNWQLVSDHSQRTLPGEHPVSSGSCSKGMAEEYVAYASNPKKKPADEDTEFVGISQKRVAEVKVEPLASLRSTSEEEMEMLTNHMTAEDDQEAEVVPESVQNPLLEVKPQSSVQTRDVEEDLLATYPLKCATEEVLSVTSTHQSQRIDASLLVPPIPDSPQMQDGLKAPLVHEKQIASEFKSPSYLKPVIDDVRLVPSVSEEQETEIDPLAQFVPRKQMINDGLFIRSISEETMTQDSLLVPAVSEAQVTEDSTLVTSELETHELETHVMKFGQLVTSASEEHETKDDMFISHSFEVQVTEDDTSAPLVPKTSAAEAASSVMSSLKTKVTLVPSIPNEGLHTRSDHLTVSNPKVLKKPVVDQDNSDDLAEDCAQEYPGSPMELDDEDSQDACENPNMGENLQAQIISVCPAVPSQGSQSGSDGAGKQDPNLTAGVCNGGIAGTGVSANQTYLSHGAAAYLGSEGEDSSLPYSLEFEKHWKATQENPSDFTAWTNLLEYVGQENYILAARKAYTAFFTCYPYCYGYWKKYADMERRFGNLKEAEEVIEQSLQAIPLSVDLWMHFITFLQETLDMIQPESVQKLRNVFEMALAAAGMDFHSDNLWDMYINWEKAQGEMQAVTAIYDRVLATPTQLYSHHFEKFKEHVTNNSPVTMVSKEEFMWLKSKLMPEAELTVNGGNGDELHVHEASEEAAQVAEVEKRSDVDLEKMKELIISLREQLYKQNEAEVSKRWTFEETIKRPYFHVKPLERAQLINWNNYLDFEIANGSHSRTIVLFERCVIACAQYEEFWLKYTKYLENHTAIGTRSVFQRSCLYHLPKKPNLHLLWATFEEKQGDIEQSRNILKTLDDAVPGLAMVRLRRVSLERRAGNIEAAEALLHESILESEGTPLAAFYSIKLARQVLKIQKNLGKAREILQEALKKDPDNTKLYLNLLEVEFSADPKHNERNTINCIAKVLRSNLPGDAKIVFSQRRVEFLEDFGSSIHSLLTAYDDHQKLLKLHAPKRKVSENGTTDEPEEKKSKVDETTSAQTVTAASSTPLIVGDASTNHITASAAYDYNTWYQNYGAYSYQNTWNYKYFPQS